MNPLQILKRHPFPVVAWFDRVLALTFAFPEEILRPLVPKQLQIDSYQGLGFVTVALVWAKNLRPAIFPEFLGQSFFLAGYRIFTRLLNNDGRRLRGLKIIRSETNKSLMVKTGNFLTHYNYQLIRLNSTDSNGQLHLSTQRVDGTLSLELNIDFSVEPNEPPIGSPFPDWKTARRFAGPMPYTFDEESAGRFVVIEGKRQNWNPKPVQVNNWKVAMFNDAQFKGVTAVLANAFMVEGIPYRWEKGRLVTANAFEAQSND